MSVLCAIVERVLRPDRRAPARRPRPYWGSMHGRLSVIARLAETAWGEAVHGAHLGLSWPAEDGRAHEPWFVRVRSPKREERFWGADPETALAAAARALLALVRKDAIGREEAVRGLSREFEEMFGTLPRGG